MKIPDDVTPHHYLYAQATDLAAQAAQNGTEAAAALYAEAALLGRAAIQCLPPELGTVRGDWVEAVACMYVAAELPGEARKLLDAESARDALPVEAVARLARLRQRVDAASE